MLPLWRDEAGTDPNLLPGLVGYLSRELGFEVAAQDFVAYVAGIAGHAGYTRLFHEDLAIPGVRIPLTRDPGLWAEAVEVGARVIWLYTYGRRYTSPAAGRPAESPRPAEAARPKVTATIPNDEGNMPEIVTYDAASETLHIGSGAIHPVPSSTWEFQVSGYLVVQRWIQRRLRDPEGTRKSELDEIVATRWSATFTTELLELLSVVALLVSEEATQADVLERVLAHDMVGASDLEEAGLLPVPTEARKPPSAAAPSEGALF